MNTWFDKSLITNQFKTTNIRLKTASNYSVSVKATSTVENDWEELIFDLSKAPIDKEFNRIFIYPDYNISNTGEVFYFDDFELIY